MDIVLLPKLAKKIHDNSDNSDVIVLLKTEHIYLFNTTFLIFTWIPGFLRLNSTKSSFL